MNEPLFVGFLVHAPFGTVPEGPFRNRSRKYPKIETALKNIQNQSKQAAGFRFLHIRIAVVGRLAQSEEASLWEPDRFGRGTLIKPRNASSDAP